MAGNPFRDRCGGGEWVTLGGNEFVKTQRTGRYLVLLDEESPASSAHRLFKKTLGISVAGSSDFPYGSAGDEASAPDGIILESLGVAILNVPIDQIGIVSALSENSRIIHVEEERYVYALGDERYGNIGVPQFEADAVGEAGLSMPQYLQGYRDGVNRLVDQILLGQPQTPRLEGRMSDVPYADNDHTWGLQATKVVTSRLMGTGIKLAILDTGYDLQHPDFAGGVIESRSFIPGEMVQDGHGHGTHCAGTACGPRPGGTIGYGVAPEAHLHVGKVLSNGGRGVDGGILEGIEWAVDNGCAVVSMSLGSAVALGDPYSLIYETAAKRALAKGALIIAAAGNESRRPQRTNPVGHPANCPSILAVAALDEWLQVAIFSCGGTDQEGGQVDIAAPGVNVKSSWLSSQKLYHSINGTSMATPHVAGVAALLAQANPGDRGRGLANLLTQGARRLNHSARDIGSGLAQAPQG